MLDDTEHEYRRLLYVAMTRAADRLIVAGIKPGNSKNLRQSCWYDLVEKGLAASGLIEEIIETDDGKIKRYMRPEDGIQAGGAVTDATAAQRVLPAWLRTSLPAPTTTSDLLRPSDSSDSKARRVRSGESVGQRTHALRRGTLVHRLLQSLPDVAAERRRDASLNFLRRNAGDWTDGDRETLTTKVLGLISDVRFAAVFADGSRAEVPIVGKLEQPGRRVGAGLRANRSSGSYANGSADRRFQDQPEPAGFGERGAHGLCPAAGALSRAAAKTLSPTRPPDRATLDRNP